MAACSHPTGPELPRVEEGERFARSTPLPRNKQSTSAGLPRCASEPAPTFIRRYLRRRWVGSAIIMVLAQSVPVMGLLDAYHIVSIAPAHFRIMCVAWMCGLFPAALIWAGASIRRLKRIRRVVRQYEYLICLQCGYSLRGLPDHYQCPECGMQFDHESLRQAWQQKLGEKSAKPKNRGQPPA